MAEEPVQQLGDFCSIAEKDLLELKDQLSKMIIAKKKIHDRGASDKVVHQLEDVLKTIATLEAIDSKLPKAIDEIRELGQKVRLLLKSSESKVGVKYGSSV